MKAPSPTRIVDVESVQMDLMSIGIRDLIVGNRRDVSAVNPHAQLMGCQLIICGFGAVPDLHCSPDGPVDLSDDQQQPTEEVGVVGDTNLGVVMLALLVMGLINYSMRDPCTC